MDTRPIPGHPGYLATYDGRIISTVRGEPRFLTPTIATVGRYQRAQVHLGRGVTRKVASLICHTFNGPRLPGEEVAHLDGNSLNNHAGNLAWKTRAENERDKIEHGTSNRGSRHGQAKLTEEDVIQIRDLASRGWSQAWIMARFKISQPTVSEIVNRKKWAWLD